MDFSKLAAIAYDDPDRAGQKLIRVFYQVGKTIRESFYDSENGWYVRRENIVANNAKTRSPIAATTQSGGKKTSVFYLNESNQLGRRDRTTEREGDKGTWTDGPITQPTSPISQSSQLAAVRSDKQKDNLRVYYQSTDNKIRGLVSRKDNGKWEASDLDLDKALPGTSLSAVSTNSEVRLFYQSADKYIKEQYSDPSTDWKASRVKSWIADNKAPLAAVQWEDPSDELQIRVLTVQSNVLVELIYNKGDGGWDQAPTSTAEIVASNASPEQLPSVAATKLDENGKFTAFYQPSRQVIAQYDSYTKRVPLGISTAID
ncbi:hypothetical protein MMC22_007457 [Lobaria immixta]|nr:hypothetical protein [Lobaria immixta]